MPATQENRDLEINTPLGKDALLLQDLTITEELGRLFSIQAEVRSTQTVTFEDLLGQNVSIRVNVSAGKRYFNGYISSMSQSIGNEDAESYALYSITIHPWFWFLTRTSDCRIFQQKTVPEIFNEVCNGLGFTDIEDRLTASYRTWEYCVQYRETDFNFLSRLLEQEGIYYYFTHEEGKHILNLADGYGSHEPIPGYANIEFNTEQTVARDDKRINSWFLSKKIQPGQYVLTEYDFVRPKADLKVDSTLAKAHSEAEHEIFDYPGEYIESSDGNHYVRTRLEELHTQYEQANGQSIARGLAIGGLFNLTDHPRKDQNREYLVISNTHSFNTDGFEVSGGGGASYTNSFSVIESSTPYRAARITPKPMVQGPQTAVVVGPSGEEIYTDEHGQVKLQFHWDRYGQSDENSSCWVRVSQLWAGKTWGGIHIPRIGQEVIVEFLEGDPDRPIVTGRVYNGDQTPPYDLPANKTQSGIKSRSSQGGSGANFNEFRFEDKKGEEEMYIHAEKDQNSIVENDQTLFVGHDQTIRVDNDRDESIGCDRSLLVERDKSEVIQRNKTTEVLGFHDEKIMGSQTILVKGSLGEMVAVNYSETVGAAMELTVGGAMAMTVGGALAESIGVTKLENIGSSKSENIGSSKSLKTGKDYSQNIGKNKSVEVCGDLSEQVKGQHKETVEKEYILQGKKIQIVGENEIHLKAGKAEIIMKKNGDITIKGKKINIKGSGDVIIKGSKIKEN